MVFKAGFARASVDRETRPLPAALQDRQALMEFGPSAKYRCMEDDPNATHCYMWGSKKGAEQVNTELMALGSVRAATLAGPPPLLFHILFNLYKTYNTSRC